MLEVKQRSTPYYTSEEKRWKPVERTLLEDERLYFYKQGLNYLKGEGFLLAKNVWFAINKSQTLLLVQARCIKMP